MSNNIHDILHRLSVLQGGKGLSETASKTFKEVPALLRTRAKRDHSDISESVLDEKASEDMVSSMKRSLTDYLGDVDSVTIDRDITDKVPLNLDLVTKSRSYNDLLPINKSTQNQTVKTIPTPCGNVWKILSDGDRFRISLNGKTTKTLFPSVDDAEIAIKLFTARREQANKDYLEEK